MAADVGYATTESWQVDCYPCLYLIDRSGKLRLAGVYDDDLTKAVAQLVAEKAPPGKP